MAINPRFTPWGTEKVEWLKKNYNLSYFELESYLEKTRRAIKHKVGELGLKRDERRKWSDDEFSVLKQNPNLSAKELAVKLGRSEYQVAHRLRLVRGSANRRFKHGWDVPSRDLAYFLGAVCSDIGIYKYNVEFTQKKSNNEMFNEVVRIFKGLFGFNPYIYLRTMDYKYKGVIIKKEHDALYVCSNQFLLNMGTEEGISAENIRGSSGEWVDFLDEKFPWVWQDPYFWSFIGGLYDGDGSLTRNKRDFGIWHGVSIAVNPVKSSDKLISEFLKRGFAFVKSSSDGENGFYQIKLNGGQDKVDDFLKNIDCMIVRKKKK